MIPFSFAEVFDDFCFLSNMVVMFGHTFLQFPKELSRSLIDNIALCMRVRAT